MVTGEKSSHLDKAAPRGRGAELFPTEPGHLKLSEA